MRCVIAVAIGKALKEGRRQCRERVDQKTMCWVLQKLNMEAREAMAPHRNDIDLNELEKLSQLQCTDEEVAAWFGVSTRTIERRRWSRNSPR